MKKLLSLSFILALVFVYHNVYAQCTPGDAISCPDPENNGEVCPDSLPNGYLNQFYSQEFTILAPPEFTDSATSITVDLHHIKIQDVANLPAGLNWVSNAEDSIFLVGEYYCVLMDGTPSEKGVFPLHIVVDVFIPGILGSPPIYVATVTDSTSLFIEVEEENSIDDIGVNSKLRLDIQPNPFINSSEIIFATAEPGEMILEVYNLIGTRVFSRKIVTLIGENKLTINTSQFESGIYFCSLKTENSSIIRKMVKTE